MLLQASNLTKRYGERTVLDIASFEIRDNASYVLIGHNGSGKTTLLRLLAGLERPTLGAITGSVGPRDIVLCLQRPYMFRGTVEDNVRYGLRARRMQSAPEQVDAVLERFRLSSLRRNDARSLSAGEMQRTALARALMCRPRLVLLDEPTANLDPESTAVIESEIRALNVGRGSVLMATHAPALAQRLDGHVLRLEQGRLVHPELNNIVEGRIRHENGTTTLAPAQGVVIRCVTERTGTCRAAIPASDIVLSDAPLDSSMTNQFRAHVTSIRLTGETVEVVLDIGIPLRASIARDSLVRMGLAVGGNTYLSFKATAVKIF